MSEDERAIRRLIETWMQATRDGDVDTVLSLMTEDVVFMVPGAEPFGREAFEKASRSMAGMRIEGTSEIAELQVLGDWAFIRNHLDIAVSPPGKEAVRRGGYTLTLLRKGADGGWRLARDANLLTTSPGHGADSGPA
jgi:uncharacterized protein (TIGR02246 family)